MKKKPDKFFEFMDEILSEYPTTLCEDHITIQRVMQQAEAANKKTSYKQTMSLLRKQEQQGRLRYLGRLKNPNGGSTTHAWELV